MYRYRSNAALWWPASGEDIDVQSLPQLPGKAVQLELKTTTPTSSGFHEVNVDLGQLWEYRQRPLGHQPFYVFPRPDWAGNLQAVAIAQGHAVTELAFSRSGRNWWFADWMVVLSAAEVAAVLRPELTAHNSRRRGPRERLVQFDSTKPTNPTWGPRHSARADPKGLIGWLDFWSELEQCGRVPPVPVRPANESQTSERPLSAFQISEVVREVIRQLAPEELPVFDSMADDWLSGGQRRWRSGKPPGAAVGFGIENLLLTQLAFPIITAVIGGVLGNVGEDRGRLWIRRRARRAPTAGVKADGPEAGKSNEYPAHDVLTSDQLRALHEACEQDARAAGMSAAKATLLADAFLGALSSRLGRD